MKLRVWMVEGERKVWWGGFAMLDKGRGGLIKIRVWAFRVFAVGLLLDESGHQKMSIPLPTCQRGQRVRHLKFKFHTCVFLHLWFNSVPGFPGF